MALLIQVGPPEITIHQGNTVLVTEPDGQINFPSPRGLYFRDTRLINSWSIFANGVSWDLLNGGATAPNVAQIHQTNRQFLSEEGPVAAHTLGLVITREIDGGLREDIHITNYAKTRVRFNLEIAIRSDFADIFEVKSGLIIRRGRITTVWHEEQQGVRIAYRNKDFRRELFITVAPARAKHVLHANGRLTFDVALKPGESWHRWLLYDLIDGRTKIRAPNRSARRKQTKQSAEVDDWQRTVLKIRTSNDQVYRNYTQSVQALAALRIPIGNTSHLQFVPAAGLPWFVALFGRDTLITSLQSMIVYPQFAAGALQVLGKYQAKERDDYRDAEPGKILHELRAGELAHFKLIPHTPYYGTADATPLYLIALHAAWRASGDRQLLKRHLKTAQSCLDWIDHYGDRDGDGFQEYQTRSKAGLENQAWKDSGDAVMYLDGTLVRGPKALCELQGYVYDAWLRAAEMFEELGDDRKAHLFRKKAKRLFEQFNETFWDEKTGFYAYALDGDKKKVLSIVSNVGQCLWSGIISPDRAGKVVRRLLEEDMWSGWGIRTLSAKHPSFNPYNYQTGAVWPHDNSLIAFGMRRYGFAEEAVALARDISDATSHFLMNRLPELYAGLQRTATGFPVQYLGANVPQAWAAATSFMLLQTILGIQQDAPRGKLFVDPVLPDWLPDITLLDLRLGREKFDIRFWREKTKTNFEVLRGRADAVEQKAMGTLGPRKS